MKHFFCAALIGAAFFATGSFGRAEDDVKNSMADTERGPKLDPGNAEAKSRKARLEAGPSPTFAITDVKATKTPDPDAETNLTLRIGVKKRHNAAIDHTKVKIQVYFYDTVDDKDIKLTDADVTYEWLTPNHDWAGSDPEMLAVTYTRPKNSVLSPEAALSAAAAAVNPGKKSPASKPGPAKAGESGRRKYLGYIVRVYYHDQLQAVRADPTRLLKLYPPSPTASP